MAWRRRSPARAVWRRRRRGSPARAGRRRSSGAPMRASPVPVQVAGYDSTFSAPKSVSLLFGLGEGDVREQVRAAHDRAVREAFAYLERSAAAVRRGAGGTRVEPADGFVAAAFRHRTSRAGDPQLHTHVLVANLAQGPDGRWSAVDGRRLYAHARDGELRLPSRAAKRADTHVRRSLAERARRDRRDRGCSEAGATGVQPAPRGDRERARASRNGRSARRRGGRACDADPEGSPRDVRCAGARLAHTGP